MRTGPEATLDVYSLRDQGAIVPGMVVVAVRWHAPSRRTRVERWVLLRFEERREVSWGDVGEWQRRLGETVYRGIERWRAQRLGYLRSHHPKPETVAEVLP